MSNFGPLCRDIIGCNVQIKGKKVIDESGNFKTPGALTSKTLTSRGDTTVCGNLLADNISPKTPSNPISINGDATVAGDINVQSAYYVNEQQVVTSPQNDPGNADATVQGTSDTCNLILQVLRTHGLILPVV